VQALPSLHAAPSDLSVTVQPPLPSHTELAWQSVAEHVYAMPPHTPPLHVSARVQALPSLHDVPSASAGVVHAPVAGLHVPAAWHWSDAAHVIGFEPVHEPP
jgi:hypothetical protein